jgi:hypothetical protein
MARSLNHQYTGSPVIKAGIWSLAWGWNRHLEKAVLSGYKSEGRQGVVQTLRPDISHTLFVALYHHLVCQGIQAQLPLHPIAVQ